MPDDIIHKPGPLDDVEWRIMRQHTLVGERILAAAPALKAVARLVRLSHERWDGEGYPDRLGGEAIPRRRAHHRRLRHLRRDDLRARLRGARSHADAIAELRRCAGEQFDPRVVEAFCAGNPVAPLRATLAPASA